MKTKPTSIQSLFSTKQGRSWQDCGSYQVVIEWQGEATAYKFPWFASLIRLVEAVDVEAMLESASPDLEILCPCGTSKVYILSVQEVIEFKELLYGTRFAISLNSMLHSQLYRAYQFA